MDGHVRGFYVDGGYGQLHGRRAAPPDARAPHGPAAAPMLLIGPARICSRFFAPLLAALGTERTALSIDLPGFGESTPPVEEPPDVRPYVDALARAAEALDLRPPAGAGLDVLGLHAGAVLAIDLATRHPGLVGRLTLAATPLFPTEAERLRALETSAAAWPVAADGSHLRAQWDYWVTHRDPALSIPQAIDCYAQVLQAGERANWVLRACLKYPLRSAATHIPVPVTLLDIRDRLTANNQSLAGLLPRPPRTHAVDLSIHGVVARPTVFAAALLETFAA